MKILKDCTLSHSLTDGLIMSGLLMVAMVLACIGFPVTTAHLVLLVASAVLFGLLLVCAATSVAATAIRVTKNNRR